MRSTFSPARLTLNCVRLLAMLLWAIPAAAHAGLPLVPERHGHRIYEYGIYRNGDEVGTHRLEVHRTGRLIKVHCESDINISLLGFSLYRFLYNAREVWDDRGLLQLSVQVNDGGDRFQLEGRRIDGSFQWTVNDEDRFVRPLPVFPTNHWNPEVLNQEQVLNTLTGKLNAVKIQSLDTFELGVSPHIVQASAYRYSGDLQLVSWYGDDGRWLGMRFKGEDGSTIEYRCSNCDAGARS